MAPPRGALLAAAAAAALAALAAAQGAGGPEPTARLLRCLADAGCLRRLGVGAGHGNDTEGNGSNTSGDNTSSPYDFPVNPRMLEFEEADSSVDLGASDEQAGKITLAVFGDLRGVVTDGQGQSVIYGHMAVPVVFKVALLAFVNGLVLDPPERRAPVEYQVLWADTCKDPETFVNMSSRCTAPYAQELLEPLLFGRDADAAVGRSFVPPARVVVGGYKWATFVASLASSQGLPYVGSFATAQTLSDKSVFPSYVRTNPTEVSTLQALISLLEHLQFTVADALACDTNQNRASATTFMDLAKSSGIAPATFYVPPGGYTAYPPGKEYVIPGGLDLSGLQAQKKIQWDNAIKGMRAFNAHAHAFMVLGECPSYDVAGYWALKGLFGSGHMWVGFDTAIPAYLGGYTDVLVQTWISLNGRESPYTSVTPFDKYVYVRGTPATPALDAFWDLMAYIGQNQDALLGPELANWIPAAKFAQRSNAYWQRGSQIEYTADAAFAVLRAINDLVLEVGENFTNAQLLARIRQSDFEGLTGRVRFNAQGDRVAEQVLVQFRLPPGTTKLSRGLQGQEVPIAMYLETLTIASPILFRAENGSKPTPPPDRDLDCDAGQWYDRDGGRCRVCSPGMFTSRTGLTMCEACVPGSFAPGNGSSSCLPCPEGYAAPASGSTNCTACTPGRYNDAVQQPDCPLCGYGAYSGAAASVCTLCPPGLYASGRGNEECDACEGVLTTPEAGATSAAECVCPAGSYRDAEMRGVCHPCPPGMICDLGADAAFLPLVASGNCTGTSDKCVIPRTAPKYMARTKEPLRSFLCLDDVACPGGPPGTCGALRNTETVACARCLQGAHTRRKDCVPCDGKINAVGLALAILACVVALVVIVYTTNRDLILQSNSTLSILVVSGIALYSVQTMGVFRTLALEWFEPLASIFKALTLIGFNLEILNLECIARPDATLMYLFRALIGPVVLCVLAITVLVKRMSRAQMDVLAEYANSAGTVFAALFISITNTCVMPLVCYRHPGNSGESLWGDPSVLCWKTSTHTSIVITGAVVFVVTVLPFVTIVAYGTIRHHHLVAKSARGRGRALLAYRFLFYRFRPEAYFYGSLLMVKGLLICFVPVVIRYDIPFQVCAMTVVLLLAQALQLQIQPWKTVLPNVVDAAVSSGLVLFLVCGSTGAGLAASAESIKALGTIIFSAVCISLGLSFVIGFVRYLRPRPYFQWFVCHHKRDAAAQARLLKLILELWWQTCFIDSDDLQDLDQLFDLVRTSVGHLLVYLSRDVLKRPWCAGEIATTVKRKAPMTGICTSSWAPPSADEIEPAALPDYLDLSSMTLQEYGITFDHVSAAYTHLLSASVRKVSAADNLCGQARFHSIVQQVLGCPKAQSPPEPRAGMLVVSTDPCDDEATAAGGILVSKVQQALFTFMPEGALLLVDGTVPESKVLEVIWESRAVAVVLSRHSLKSLDQLQVIAYCMGRLRAKSEAVDPRLTPFEVIPLTTPSFEFPASGFFDSTVPRMWPAGDAIAGADAGASVRAFFKRLAVNFSTHASDSVLSLQAEQLVERVPKKWQAAARPEGDLRARVAEALKVHVGSDGSVGSAGSVPQRQASASTGSST